MQDFFVDLYRTLTDPLDNTIPMAKQSQTCPNRAAEDTAESILMRSFPESRLEIIQKSQYLFLAIFYPRR